MCGSPLVEAHHLIHRSVGQFCVDVKNGILLCPYDHKENSKQSPHKNKMGFEKWLEITFPEKYKWYIENKWKLSFKEIDFKEEYYYLKNLIDEYDSQDDSILLIKEV